MRKEYLMTAGPTPVPEKVRVAEAQPIIYHRAKEHREIFKRVSENLKSIFKTQNTVLTFTSSGTGAMEGAVVNTLSAGDKVLVVRGGKFSERWSEICVAYGIEVDNIDVEWGDIAAPGLVKEYLDKEPGIRAFFSTLCETSTGTLFPIKEYGELIKGRDNTIFVVDAISGLGACDIEVDKWGVDICVCGSQKALMLPPGLGFASVSEKAWGLVGSSRLPKFYFNFEKARSSLEKGDTPFTPAISLIIAMDASLKLLGEEGIGEILERHSLLASATRAGVQALGLELFSKYPANTVTAIKVPEGIDGSKLIDVLFYKYGVKVAGGQSQLKGKIFRIAHLGYMGQFDVIIAITATELALKDMGYGVEIGAGVKAAEEVLAG
ncbi:MAG: alanine--glyoxylate aminotransferase family protein [Candidatus Stahlbacteria bacterium]|nr:alanine--glyoxylate aminotransferase family protein [Candidatus Stahlbacteria bacterium]